MAQYACTYLFEGVQNSIGTGGSFAAGWSETYYTNSTVASADAAIELAARTDPLIAARLDVLSGNYVCPWIRVANVGNPNDVKVAGLTNYVGQASKIGAQVQCAVLVDLYAPPQGDPDFKSHHRRILLRGLPADMVLNNVINTLGSWSMMAAFLNVLAVKPAGGVPPVPAVVQSQLSYMKVRNPAISVNVPLTALVTVPPSENTIDITAAALVGTANGKKVELLGVKTPTGVNRIWTVAPGAAAGSLRLAGPRRGFGGVWNGTGTARLVSYMAARMTQWTAIGLRSKKTGGPFKQLVGRQSGE